MENSTMKKMRIEAQEIFKSAVESVNPYQAVRRFVRVEGGRLSAGPEDQPVVALNMSEYDRILVVGGGKATAPMAKAMEELLGSRISQGIINVKYGFGADLTITEIVEASHPLPDMNGIEGTSKILDLLQNAGEKDLVFSLISGGGSALLVQPAGGITLEEMQDLTRSLLECGASIDEINTLRKHISSAKGGQMARAAMPATTINLMLSDVVGDSMDVIASGPFVPDTSTFEDALDIITKYDLKEVPAAIQSHLAAGMEGRITETPKAGDPAFDRVHNLIIGSNILALQAAEERAKSMGYNTLILSSMIEGETREVARVHTGIAREMVKTGRPVPCPGCVISGGETTVTIRGKGLGGRNQEFCLAAALELKGLSPRIVVLSGGTDGDDGPTNAAGAIVDPMTVRRGKEAGISASDFLGNNDAYHFFEKTDDLLITGPTGTNVMDVRLVLVR
ncbi:MAG: glycerate kinase [Deltaproteobacteria bacterium]|nr:glycerate kinase [Deltaproteobacteria bacterium]